MPEFSDKIQGDGKPDSEIFRLAIYDSRRDGGEQWPETIEMGFESPNSETLLESAKRACDWAEAKSCELGKSPQFLDVVISGTCGIHWFTKKITSEVRDPEWIKSKLAAVELIRIVECSE